MRIRMKWLLAAFAGLGLSAGAAHAQVGYTLDVTTSYSGGFVPDAGPVGSPDTGFATFTNNGTTVFVGNLVLDGTSPGQGHLNTTLAVTLNPGDSKTLTLSDESSNQGGWNNPGGGNPDNGIEISFVGTVGGTELVNLSVFDKDVHSGAPRTNPFGVTLDNYVLQGGDPIGRDTGDGYEETQASGHFEFFEAPAGIATPLPASAWGGLALLSGLAASRFVRRRSSVA